MAKSFFEKRREARRPRCYKRVLPWADKECPICGGQVKDYGYYDYECVDCGTNLVENPGGDCYFDHWEVKLSEEQKAALLKLAGVD